MIFSLAWSWPRPADASGRRLGSMFFSLPRGKLWPSSGYPGAGPGPVRTTHRGLGSMILVLSSGWPSLPSPPFLGLLGSLLERSLVLKWSTGPRYPGGSDQSVKHDLFLGPISFPSLCMTPFLGHHYFSASQKQDFWVALFFPRMGGSVFSLLPGKYSKHDFKSREFPRPGHRKIMVAPKHSYPG